MQHRNDILRRVAALLIFAAGVVSSPSTAKAVVIASADSSANTSASQLPSSDPYDLFPSSSDAGFSSVWDSVGYFGNKSCVYLGNGWVLGAAHAGSSSWVEFDGVSYATVGSPIQLTEPSSPSTLVDLELTRLAPAPTNPSWPAAPTFSIVSASTPVLNQPFVAIGNTWYARVPSSQETVNPSLGFSFSAQSSPTRWGDGTFGSSRLPGYLPTGGYPTDDLYSLVSGPGDPNAMIGASGDSGGGVFIYNSAAGKWELAGILLASSGSPALYNTNTSFTVMADLTQYQGEIATVTPEPSSVALLLAGGAVLWTCRRFRARDRRCTVRAT
jgi:hypothetical protein